MNSEEPSIRKKKKNTKSDTSQGKSLTARSNPMRNLKIEQIRDSCRRHAPGRKSDRS